MYVPAKSPFEVPAALRSYLEREYAAIAREFPAVALPAWIQGHAIIAGAPEDGLFSDLQDALNEGAERGKEVVFSGEWIRTESLIVPSGTHLRGTAGAKIKAGASISLIVLDGVDDVVLEHFELDGDRDTFPGYAHGVYSPANGTGCNRILLEHLNIHDVGGVGVLVLAQTGSHSADVAIKTCRVKTTGAHGVICQDFVDRTLIAFNHVEDFGLDFSDTPGITTGRSAFDHRVIGNQVIGNPAALGSSVHGISLDACERALCNDNVVRDCVGFAIEVGGVIDGAVCGNVCNGGDRSHIVVHSAGLDTRGIVVAGNQSKGSGDAGIMLQIGVSVEPEDVVITGNTIVGAVVGIRSYAGFDVTISGNGIRECSKSGIYVIDSDRFVIVGNRVNDNNTDNDASHAGIRIVNDVSESEFVVGRNQVKGNGVGQTVIDNTIDDPP